MRHDVFIVWGNGLDYIPNIVDMVRSDENFNILRMVYKDIDNMQEFIRDVYECDTVPWEHLVAKSKYLLEAEKRCMCILVENKNPNEKIMGEGRFRHIQCQKINNLKASIRGKYNPRTLDPNSQRFPLPMGVSHDHCIHATDYEEQTEYLLKYFNLNTIAFYKRYDNYPAYIPWHLDVTTTKVVDVAIADLRANINGRSVKIEDTPHYQYVLGNQNAYKTYFHMNFGRTLQEDHFPESFDDLINNFDENYKRYDGKESYIIINKENIISDGVHRASILKSNRKDVIKCLMV